MHGVAESRQDRYFRKILNTADLVVPDGMPLVWLGRARGIPLKRRVYGPELLEQFCERTEARAYRHFFYGGAPGVAEALAKQLKNRHPGMVVVGTFSPPFRPLAPNEDDAVVEAIDDSGADIVWIGLSTPKQERWMFDHYSRLRVPVLIGVGAAFDFHTGRSAQAPEWMREHGLEWLFRLCTEPRRLWRRYLINGPRFSVLAILELMRLRKF
jgi:N-acetylglucosaminyldiphosphoundecaprenol N-acetyl-beta-D-mannosaminyltransferase